MRLTETTRILQCSCTEDESFEYVSKFRYQGNFIDNEGCMSKQFK